MASLLSFVGAVVALGHGLGLHICAEGVETPEQAALLRRLGCDIGQGYFLSRPLPPDRMTVWLEAISGEGGAQIEGAESVDAESSSSSSSESLAV